MNGEVDEGGGRDDDLGVMDTDREGGVEGKVEGEAEEKDEVVVVLQKNKKQKKKEFLLLLMMM